MKSPDQTMVYTAGAISAMGRRPRDENPFDPSINRADYNLWLKGWLDYRRTSDVAVSNWWRAMQFKPDPETIS